MKPKTPMPIAFCWYSGREMSKRDIERKRCLDPVKQLAGKCKHLQFYGGSGVSHRQLTMLELYRIIKNTLDEHAIRLEGSSLSMVQEMPDGKRTRLWLDEAEEYWSEHRFKECE